jgi:protein TorT
MDKYWLSVGNGLKQEVACQNVDLKTDEASGYRGLSQQLDTCTKQNVDAIMIGAVSSNDPNVIAGFSCVAHNIPVFGLVDKLHSDALIATTEVERRGREFAIAHHLVALHPAGPRQRLALVKSALQRYPGADYPIGSAPNDRGGKRCFRRKRGPI